MEKTQLAPGTEVIDFVAYWSNPVTSTRDAWDFAPFFSRISARGTPPQLATLIIPKFVSGTFPAHSIKYNPNGFAALVNSSIVRVRGFSTSPSTRTRHDFTSGSNLETRVRT